MKSQSFLLMALLVPMIAVAQSKPVSIVPKPVQMALQAGSFRLAPNTIIVADKVSLSEGRFLAGRPLKNLVDYRRGY